jgi:general secretion pathway protein F
MYPIVLSVMCAAIVSGLLVFVVPKVVSVFESTKAKLPLSTRVLIGTSDFFREYGIYLLIGGIVGAFLLGRWLRNPVNRRRWHRLQLRIPVAGKLSRGFNTARFTRTFSILSGSSVPVLEAMRIAGEVVTNLPMRDAVTDAAARVREGAAIARLRQASSSRP